MEENFPPKKRKTENRSFRIDISVLEGLEEEAARKKVSVNTLVNQLLADYIEVGRHRKRLGTMSMSVSAFQRIIAAASDEDMKQAGSLSGRSIPKAYSLSKWGRESVPNVLRFIRENAPITSLYDYSESPHSPKAIILTHPYGRKWSLYLSCFFVSAFEEAGQKVQSKVSEQAVIFEMT